MRRGSTAAFFLIAAIAGCGGSGGSSTNPPPVNPPAPPAPQLPPPAVNASAGGIWHGISTSNETLTFLVAEDGDLRSIQTSGPPGSNPPAFGSGAAIVLGNDVTGAYDSRRLPSLAAPLGSDESCELTGTLSERVSMSITLKCTDDAGAERSAAVILGYDTDYDAGSALSAIAGNYVLSFRPMTNFLNVNGDGVLFGMYDNGADCTVNGAISLIDPLYNLYRFEWQLSGCKQPFLKFEGATLTGLGYTAPRGAPAGSFIVLLAGTVEGRLEAVSVLYEPP